MFRLQLLIWYCTGPSLNLNSHLPFRTKVVYAGCLSIMTSLWSMAGQN